MKPFNVNRNSWHYKLNKNFMNPDSDDWYMHRIWEPQHNNFCSYWRATMIRLILAAALLALAIFMVSGFATALYLHPIPALAGLGTVLAFFGIAAGIAWVVIFRDQRTAARLEAGIPDSLFVQKYKAYKSKICPSVEYEK